EGDAARRSVVGDLFGWADAADAAGVDLDEADAAIVDEMARHVRIVTALAGGEAEGAGLSGESAIGVEGAADERLLEPMRAELDERGQPGFRRRQVVDPDGAGVDQHDAVRPETLACRRQLI